MGRSTKSKRRARLCTSKLYIAAASAVSAGFFTHPAAAQVSLTMNGNNWTISDPNSRVSAVFSTTGQDITSIKLGLSSNLLGGSTPELDEEIAGTPFGSNTAGEAPGYSIGPNGSYVDVWTTVPSLQTTVNPITYAFHYVMFANDPTIYCYEAVSHDSRDPATSIGQGQFLFRSDPSIFPNLYQVNTGPNQVGISQTTIGIPSTNPGFSAATAQAGRTVQNVTYDLTGTGIAGDNGTNFFTKYDYSIYSQFFQAETMYGPDFAVSEVVPSEETLTGGPTKQELAWTDPGILNMEFLSDHYGIDGKGSYPGYGVQFPASNSTQTDLFGPFGFTISATGTQSAAQINQNAISNIPNDISEFNEDTELIASGYVPTSQRGNVQINAADPAGWSSNTTNNTIVLSEPGVNFQESTTGDQYWAQINPNGTATLNNVTPGTYRMTLYELGQWGETRVDGVVVQGGKTTLPQNLAFTPENFGAAPPIWTIGTPDRSSNEFTNGHDSSFIPGSSGTDLRQYYGAYDMWAEEAAMGTPGYVSYNATATTINGVAEPATNDPNAWIANQWYTFDPPLYDPSNGTSTNYQFIAPAYVRDPAHGGTGLGPANYHGLPWQVHFTTTADQLAQGQYTIVSVAVVSLMASLNLSLNGHVESWSFGNFSPNDPQVRSGDSGFYQWAAFEFPTIDLNAAGVDNVLSFSVSAHTDGVMYDALRMEITNTSANPDVTGWNDYTYIDAVGTNFAPNDGIGQVASDTFTVIPEPSTIALAIGCGGLPLLRRRRRRARQRNQLA